MKTYKKYFITLLGISFLLLNNCIDDNIIPPLSGELDSTAELLVYIEAHGDFANSHDAPALVDAEEVNANLSSYLIIDTRQRIDFLDGHIAGSLNVTPDSLYDFLENINTTNYSKIVLVSKNGQSSAYYTCLFRLAGFENIYTMNFGLAAWNYFFADEWLGALRDDAKIGDYTNDASPKSDYTSLPKINFASPESSIEERLKSRIKKIISEGFNNDSQYRTDIPTLVEDYVICYGIQELYYAPSHGPGHYPGTKLFLSDPVYEFRAYKSLQTIPADSSVLIYDANGQLGACITAYLRVLGYDAKTLLFGGNHILYYNRITSTAPLIPFAFDVSDIKNYPYVTGN